MSLTLPVPQQCFSDYRTFERGTEDTEWTEWDRETRNWIILWRRQIVHGRQQNSYYIYPRPLSPPQNHVIVTFGLSALHDTSESGKSGCVT